MRQTLSAVANQWLALLPEWPYELHWLTTLADMPDVWTLRWLREQVRQARLSSIGADDRADWHIHLGLLGDADFRQRMFNGLSQLLAIEAAQESMQEWPTIDIWEQHLKSFPEGHQLALFNPLMQKSTENAFLLHEPAAEKQGSDLRTFRLANRPEVLTQIPSTQAALYQLVHVNHSLSITQYSALKQQLCRFYSPSATEAELTDGRVAQRVAPVATWAFNYHFDRAEKGLTIRLADTTGFEEAATAFPAPLLWQISSSDRVANRRLLRQSSILFFFGRIPGARAFGSNDTPKARLALSLTLRPRPLSWDQLAANLRGTSVSPSLAANFGLPPAREFIYDQTHFYSTPQTAQEKELRELLTSYYAVQERENELRAESHNPPLLPLPWNLLHWIADTASGKAVADYIFNRYNEAGISTGNLQGLNRLVTALTTLLAELRPAWRQIERLPAAAAYVVVPAHLYQPNYLPAFRPLHDQLFSHKRPQLAHLTFLSYAQLNETLNYPHRPVYLMSLQGKYWWQLQQLAPHTSLQWTLHAGLYHDAFCQELCRQHKSEQTALHYQLGSLTVLAPDPEAAAKNLAQDLADTAPELPIYYHPTYFPKPGRAVPLGEPAPETAAANRPAPPTRHSFAASGTTRVRKPGLMLEALPDTTVVHVTDTIWEKEYGEPQNDQAEALDIVEVETHLQPEQVRKELEDDIVLERYGMKAEVEVPKALDIGAIPSMLRVRHKVPRVFVNGVDCGPAIRLVWVQKTDAHQFILEHRPLETLRTASDSFAGDKWLDERLLRSTLRQEAALSDTLDVTDAVLCPDGIPFWKFGLSRWTEENPGRIASKRIEHLFAKMSARGLGVESFDYFKKNYLAYWIDDYGQRVKNRSNHDHIPQTWADRALVCEFIGEVSTSRMMLLRERRQELRRTRLRNYQQANMAALEWVSEQQWVEFTSEALTNRLSQPKHPLLATPAIHKLFGNEPNPAATVAEFVLARLRQSLCRVTSVELR